MKADTIHCYCRNKCMRRGIAESLHAYMNRARLTACMWVVGVWSREVSQLSKYTHTDDEPPKFISHGHIFLRDSYVYIYM